VTEDDVVAAIRAIAEPIANPAIKLGIGDDAALWQPSRSCRSAIASDMLVEGVHFTRAIMSLEDAGWRAMAANASDLAAMGARAVLATVALGVVRAMSLDDILETYRGLAAAARRSGITIVGGDLSRTDALTIAISVVGEVRASNVKTRAGGRPNDVLAVTGPLGAARAGLEIASERSAVAGGLAEAALRAFRRPEPRTAEGRFLAASRNVRAMLDCSDGLSIDLDRLCQASSCGALLESVPVAEPARAVAEERGEDPERFTLAGGEDFELVVAVRPHAFSHLATRFAARFHRPLLRIGALRAEPRIIFNGNPLTRTGWDHFS
jgi:thiamine-monophosphate kinase